MHFFAFSMGTIKQKKKLVKLDLHNYSCSVNQKVILRKLYNVHFRIYFIHQAVKHTLDCKKGFSFSGM